MTDMSSPASTPNHPESPALRRHRLPLSLPVIMGLVALFDIAAIIGAGIGMHNYYVWGELLENDLYVFCLGATLILTIMLMRYGGVYQLKALLSPWSTILQIIIALSISFMFLLALLFSLKISEEISRIWIFGFFGFSYLGVATVHVITWMILSRLGSHGLLTRNVLVVGASLQAEKLIGQMKLIHPHLYQFIGVFDDRIERSAPTVAEVPVLGNLDELIQYTRKHDIDDIIIALPWSANERLLGIIGLLRELPVNIYMGTDLIGLNLNFAANPSNFAGLPVFQVVKSPLNDWNVVVKWLEDYVLGFIALVAFAPVMAAVALAIKLESKGPVFFKQPRNGFNNKPFHVYKFRSMYHGGVPPKTTQQATKDDPRITRVGRFIRKTSLDELPQILNVLKGEMSMVGPRPHAVDHNEEYGAIIKGYFARHNVKPGITGWAQINGLRGETDTIDKMEARVRFDSHYVENWSLLFDLQILFRTAFVFLGQKNAY